MKVKVRDIPDAGLALVEEVAAEEIELEDSFFKSLTPLSVAANIILAEEAVVANVEVSGKFELTCGRCLEPFAVERNEHLDLYFEVDPQTEFIELGEDIRQEMIMILSGILLCGEDCRGLCQQCGTNLNHQQCNCPPKVEEEPGGRGINI